MGLPHLSVQRPISILMVSIALVVFDAISLSRLPVELYPNFSFGVISIFIDIRGGIPPTEAETLVAKPVEEAVGTVSYLRDIISISEEGHCIIQMWFEPGIDMDLARLEVSEKFSRVKSKLPSEIEKPVIAKYDQAQYPVLILAVAGEGYTPEQLRKLVEERIKDRIQRVMGVANIEIGGGRERKILIEVDQHRVQAMKLPIMQVINMLNLNNLNLLAGEIKKIKDKYLVRTVGEFGTLVDIGQVGVATTPQGSIIRVRDVAEIKDSFLEATSYARVNTLPVVNLYIQKESLANTVSVCDGIEKELEAIKKEIDPKVRLIATHNQAEMIKRAVKEVYNSMIFGSVLVALVLFFFLGHKGWIAISIFGTIGTVICSIFFAGYPIVVGGFAAAAVVLFFISLIYGPRPVAYITAAMFISVIVTFAPMFLSKSLVEKLGFPPLTINMSTLGGIILGLGMLVDNAIVVSENIMVRRHKGLDMRAGAIVGSEEMFLAIVASSFTNIVVFLPIIFLPKETAILYSGLALTMVFSLTVSLLVAVSLVPMLFSTLGGTAEFGLNMGPFRSWYRKILGYCIRQRWFFVGTMVAICILAGWVLVHMPNEFIESASPEEFTIFIELPTGAKLGKSDEVVAKVEEVLAKVPEIKTKTARIEPWSSKIYVKLTPAEYRRRSTKDVINSLRPQVEKIQPAFIYFEEPQEVEADEVILDIYGYDYEVLTQLADAMASRIGGIKGLTDVKIRHRPGRPEYKVIVDKERAAALGLSMEEVANILHAQMRGLRATLYRTEGKEVEVVVRLAPKFRKSLSDLRRLTFTLPNGEQVYLEQISRVDQGLGPSKIWRKNKNRMIQVSANKGMHPFGKAVELIRGSVKDIKFPANYFYRFGENYERMVENQRAGTFALILVVVLVYLVLAALFESYLQPFIIMTTVPMALIGVAVALRILNIPLSMAIYIGIMVLAGVVVNASIIMLDHMNSLKALGYSKYKMLIRGGQDRLRPIFMTVITTILGFLPLALSKAAQLIFLSRMAVVLTAGLFCSTILTLLFLPSIYLVFEDVKGWLLGLAGRRQELENTKAVDLKRIV